MMPDAPGPQDRDQDQDQDQVPALDARQSIRAIGWASLIAAAALVGLLLLLVVLNHGTLRPQRLQQAFPPHPPGVPADAVFRSGPVGGHFIRLERADLTLADGRQVPAFLLGAWDSRNGRPEYVGHAIFISERGVSAEGEAYFLPVPEAAAILSSAYFDGNELRFDIAGRPDFGRIIPLHLPPVRVK